MAHYYNGKYFDPNIYSRQVLNFNKGIADLHSWRDNIEDFDKPLVKQGALANIKKQDSIENMNTSQSMIKTADDRTRAVSTTELLGSTVGEGIKISDEDQQSVLKGATGSFLTKLKSMGLLNPKYTTQKANYPLANRTWKFIPNKHPHLQPHYEPK